MLCGPEENRTPFYSMPWSYTTGVLRARMVDLSGVEPLISAMRMRRITNCATGPNFIEIIASFSANYYFKKDAGLTGVPFLRTSK